MHGVVLPLLAAAYDEHDEAEHEHDGSPGEIEVDAHGFFVDPGGVAGEEAVETHKTADEQEDKAEGNADVESHISLAPERRKGFSGGRWFEAAGMTFCDKPSSVPTHPYIGEKEVSADVAAIHGVGYLTMRKCADGDVLEKGDMD